MSIGSEHFCGSVALNAARQDSAVAVFFRGYLTNQTELARRLGIDNAAGSCVLDVIGECYKRWGRTLLSVLDGQFALVIADRSTGDILLTRDVLGVIPLYWSVNCDTLRFATRLRDLVDGDTRDALNLKEVRRFILFGAVSEETVYSAVRRLEPGSSMWIHNGRIARDVRWDPRSLKPITYNRSDEYVEHFVHLVHQSVQGALKNCQSGWISLSGGLDSNTILPPALETCPGLHAFSIIAPQWPEEDESGWIKRIVAARGIPWRTINAEEVLPFSEFPKGFCGGPDTGVIHQGFRSALNTIVGANVLLTGDGGDSFMGSQMGPIPSHLADPIFDGDLTGAVQDLDQWRRQSKPARSKAYWMFHAFIVPVLRHLLRRNVRAPHYHLHPGWLRFGRRLRFGSGAQQPKSMAPRCRTPGQQAILDDLWQCAEDPVFDRLYSTRHPLFCRPLFEFLWAIPWSQKHLPLCDRYIERRALKGLVDDDTRTRISSGLGTRTFVEGLRRSKQWQDYLCEGPEMAKFGLVSAEKWRQAIQQACAGQTRAEPLLVRAIGVEVWLKQLLQFRPV
jgi:hypothetical protein